MSNENKLFTTRVPRDLIKRLKTAAVQREEAISALVTRAITELLNNLES